MILLFGKNSVAGALNVTTARPTDELEGSIFVSTETEDGETIIEGVLSGPFSDSVRARIAARSRDSDGYLTNEAHARHDFVSQCLHDLSPATTKLISPADEHVV